MAHVILYFVVLGEDGKDPYLKAAAFPIADNPYSYGEEQYFIPSLQWTTKFAVCLYGGR